MQSRMFRRLSTAAALVAVLAGCNGDAAGPFGPVPAGVSGRIAYSTDREVYVWAVRGGGVNRIYLADPNTSVTSVAWASGDSLVLGLAWRERLPGTVIEEADDWLLKLAADGSGARRLFDTSRREFMAGVAPDGRVAYWTSRIFGDTATMLRVDDVPVFGYGYAFGTPVWSPAGDAMYFADYSLKVLRPGGLPEELPGPPAEPYRYVSIGSVAVSPDGRLAYSAVRGLGRPPYTTEYGIWVAHSTGANAQRVSGFVLDTVTYYPEPDSVDRAPVWSADGRGIMFLRRNSIWLVPALGGAEQLVARIPGVRNLAWRP